MCCSRVIWCSCLPWKSVSDGMEVQPPSHLSVVERYYQRKYYINEKDQGEDVCVLTHSNKVCLVTLAESHPVLREKKTVVRVDWRTEKFNRLSNRVTGKGKKGAQSLSPTSLLCEIVCDDGSTYKVPCGLKSQLLEINDSLKKKPSLIAEKPQGEGFVAVVLAKLKDYEGEMKKLMSQEEYQSRAPAEGAT